MSNQSKISVIVPVYNLAQRGIERVRYSLYSIGLNSVVPHVVVMDGRAADHFEALGVFIKDLPFVEHVRATAIVPKWHSTLLNRWCMTKE